MYLKWNEKTTTNFSDDNINSLYNEGYLFTREHLGSMYQTRSLRIDLNKFKLSSENKRILKKTENLTFTSYELPVTSYNWQIGKIAKDFYETKFGKGVFSANKIKELLTTEHNFNKLFKYVILNEVKNPELERDPSTPPPTGGSAQDDLIIGYAICHETNEILHYSYPFYSLTVGLSNLGMGMMLRAILYAKENNKKYIYLGSAQRPTDTYKLQFTGLEWFDGEKWSDSLNELKEILK